jgi:DNA-binding MarR family transcriptional regulator
MTVETPRLASLRAKLKAREGKSEYGEKLRGNPQGNRAAHELPGLRLMTNESSPNVTVDFLVRLRKIDKRTLTVRDVLVLYAVIENPGIAGNDVSHKLGLDNRSSIASNLLRLQREGYIEDRREVRRKANPAILHVLPAGIAFWDDIKP